MKKMILVFMTMLLVSGLFAKPVVPGYTEDEVEFLCETDAGRKALLIEIYQTTSPEFKKEIVEPIYVMSYKTSIEAYRNIIGLFDFWYYETTDSELQKKLSSEFNKLMNTLDQLFIK